MATSHDSNRKLIVLGGAAGVGKTSVARDICRWVKDNSPYRTSLFGTGNYFQAALSTAQGTSLDRDEIRHTDWRRIEDQITEQIISDYDGLETNTHYLLDTHFAADSPLGYIMGLGVKCLERLASACFPDALARDGGFLVAVILIDADIVQVLKRRQTDLLRFREMSVLDVVRNLELNRVYSLEYYNAFARHLGHSRVQYLHVTNEDTEKCADEIGLRLKQCRFFE